MELREIKGFENYVISSNGQIYNGEKQLKTRFNERNTPFVTLRKNGKYHTFGIAKLVLLTFKGEPKYPSDVALYKDGNNHNVDISNLEWCNRSEAYSNLYKEENRYSEKRLENLKRAISRPVTSYKKDKLNELKKVKEYDSITEAATDLGVGTASVSRCLKNKNSKCRGLYFRERGDILELF